MTFAAIFDYNPDDPKLPEVRPVHRKYLTELLDKGKLVISGPFMEGGGALIVYETESKEETEALIQADPFTTSGVFKSWVIRPWNPLFVNRGVFT